MRCISNHFSHLFFYTIRYLLHVKIAQEIRQCSELHLYNNKIKRQIIFKLYAGLGKSLASLKISKTKFFRKTNCRFKIIGDLARNEVKNEV